LLLIAALAGCARASAPVTAVRPKPGQDPAVTRAAAAVSAASRPVGGTTHVEPIAPGTSVGESIDQMLVSLGDSVSPLPATVLAASAATAEPDVTWDIDVRSYLTHDRVEYYVQRFTGDARDRVVASLSRGRRYEPMIRSKFRAAGIPEDMYYLGLVESGYDPHAYSRAAAVGIWQFMTSTGRDMGLRIDWWIDERRDPIKSTVAAARFLSDLRDQFGSVYLAAAAYNGGPGRVARGVSRYADAMEAADGEERFFVLADHQALRSETSNYVPQLIAAAIIGKNPSRYGISFDAVTPYAYDSVVVPASTPLAAVARGAGVSLEAIRDLNPFVLRGVTAPSGPMKVRLPVGTAGHFDSAFALLPDSERAAFHKVVTKKASTVASEARKSGLTVSQLRSYNPRLSKTKSGKLAAGEVLLIPTAQVVRAAFDVPDPAIERWGTSSPSGVHVVRRGESLSSLAARYHTTAQALMRLNKLKKPVIYPGQAILVRRSSGATKARRVASTSGTTKTSGATKGKRSNH
jgi:peptidoglycan lytic transglycosylase D